MGATRGSGKAALLEGLRTLILTQTTMSVSDLGEARLSTEFDLSRTPLREALRELAGQSLVELTPNRGARVVEMSHTTLRDFFLAALMVYGAILRLAAIHALRGQMDALKHEKIEFRAALTSGDVAAKGLAGNRFHPITGDMAGNIYLRPNFHRLLIDHARISIRFYGADSSDETGDAADQHDATIDAIVARDPEVAAKFSEDQWDRIDAHTR